LARNLNLTEARLEGNIKIFEILFIHSLLRGPKKAKEYISHGFAEATEQGNKTFSSESNRKMRKFFFSFFPACEFMVSLSSTPLSYTRIWAPVLSFAPQFVEYAPVF